MEITPRTVGTLVILDIKGDLTAGVASTLTEKVHSLLHEGYRDFVLNLTGVAHIDSTGIGELMTVHTLIMADCGRVRLAGLTRRVDELLAITKLLTVFDIFDAEAPSCTL